MIDKKQYLLFGGITSVVAILVIVFIFSGGTSKSEKAVTFGQVEQTRQDVMVKRRMERQRVEMQNYQSAPALGVGYQAIKDHSADQEGLRLESNHNAAAQDSRASEVANKMPTNVLETQINNFLAKRQKYEEMTLLQKKQFIESYKRQAAAMGYILEVDSKMNIVRFERGPAAVPRHEPQPGDVEQIEDGYYDEYEE